MRKVKRIVAAKAHPPAKPYYSPAVLVESGRLLFISGKGPFDPNMNLVGKGDVKAQTEQVIQNIKACLEEVGATLDDVVNVTVFVKDIRDVEKIAEVRLKYFTKGVCTSTLVQVANLGHPDMLIEMNAIAVID